MAKIRHRDRLPGDGPNTTMYGWPPTVARKAPQLNGCFHGRSGVSFGACRMKGTSMLGPLGLSDAEERIYRLLVARRKAGAAELATAGRQTPAEVAAPWPS